MPETYELIHPDSRLRRDLLAAIRALPHDQKPCCMTDDGRLKQAIEVGTWEFTDTGVAIWLDPDGEFKVEIETDGAG